LFVVLAAVGALLVAAAPQAVLAQSPAQRTANGIVAFVTDWGERDFYVGAAKGVALSIFPEVKLVDITHYVEPYEIMEGAVTLMLAAREFPTGTTFVAVVDPGVGTERRPIVVHTNNDLFFVGPDNGLFTLVMQEFGVRNVYHITNPSFMRPGKISYSFHGRDIFTPTATHIAAGRPVSDVGPVIDDYIMMDIQPARREGDALVGEIIFVDVYGNMQANIDVKLVDELGLAFGDEVWVTVGDTRILSKFVNTYGDVPVGDDLIFIASTDLLEISVNFGNAAERFGAGIGSPVRVERVR